MQTKNEFNQHWQVEDIKSKIESIAVAVENNNFESAMSMLHIIQVKAIKAENIIKEISYEELNVKKDVQWYGTYGQLEALCPNPNCLMNIWDYQDNADEHCPFCKQLINWNSKL